MNTYTCTYCNEPIEWDRDFHEWQHPGWADPLCDPTGETRRTWATPAEPVDPADVAEDEE